ncbi:hypothetical protein M2323_000565 [Rhodoblastus acidophilus]|uniref:hypothetical protein n=1 Tax=Rhodoblastus acidophilus TaxID=1074 RepID=UPI0022250920|nr:hypothetical protein [Rhodoblastus acidophilus]MCW2282800.1 hypothetical protein [Rhodoblastus acidophilus]MCW2331661.1 hypothetical protein [Rhodoblastus acidophilus]
MKRSISHTNVMPGLVPGIHADPQGKSCDSSRYGAAWMAGTTPGHDDIQSHRLRENRVTVEP